MKMDVVQAAYTRSELASGELYGKLAHKAFLSYHFDRGGDVFYQLKPFYVEKDQYGTSHGSPYAYDSHVPNLWFGMCVKPGTFTNRTGVSDIAPTLCQILGISPPAMCTGNPLF